MTIRSAVGRSPWWMPWALVAGILGGGLLMVPVLLSPVSADDRYQYILQPGLFRDYWHLSVHTWQEMWASLALNGRFAPVDYIIQRSANKWVTDTAVAMGLDLYVVQAALKVALLVSAVVALWWLLRQMRVRAVNGDVIAPSGRLVALSVLAVSVLLVCGGQTQYFYRSAWVAYPVLTYPAVTFVLLGLGVLLWLSNMLGRSWRWWPLLTLTVPLAAFFVLQYELYWTIAPLALLVLVMHTPTDDVRRGRRIKSVVAGLFLAAFAAVMLPIRMALAQACAVQKCPGNTSIEVGLPLLRTWAMNMVSALPGSGVMVGRHYANDRGVHPPAFLPLAGWGLLWALMLLVGCWALLRHVQRSSTLKPLRVEDSSSPSPAGWQGRLPRGDRALGVILMVFGAAWALGTALIMSLSPMAQIIVLWPGQPFRGTVATWFALGMTAVGAVIWWGPWRETSRVALVRAWWPLAAVALVAGALAYPTNVRADYAARHRPFERVTDEIHSQVIFNDASAHGPAIRCQLIDELYEVRRTAKAEKDRIRLGANAAMEHYWGTKFCDRESP